jgi:hypothetical protein
VMMTGISWLRPPRAHTSTRSFALPG